MKRRLVAPIPLLAAAVSSAGWLSPAGAAGVGGPPDPTVESLTMPGSAASTGLEMVADRYRQIDLYTDRVQLTQVLTPASGPAHRVETELACEFSGDRLTVTTPWRQLRSLVGLGLETSDATPAARARRDYDLWLAPHMVFRFRDDPVRAFRADAVTPFAVTIAEPAVRSEQRVARFHIESGRSWFDVFVDPVTRLIVAINGSERLADGSTLRTEMTVTPVLVDGRSWTPSTTDEWAIEASQLSASEAPTTTEPPATCASPPVAMPAETQPAPAPAPTPTPTPPIAPRTPNN